MKLLGGGVGLGADATVLPGRQVAATREAKVTDLDAASVQHEHVARLKQNLILFTSHENKIGVYFEVVVDEAPEVHRLDAVHHVPEHDEGSQAAVGEPQVAADVARTLSVQPLAQRLAAELHLDHQRQLLRILQ